MKKSWKVTTALLMLAWPLSGVFSSYGPVQAATTTDTNLYLVANQALSSTMGTSAAADAIPAAPDGGSIGTPAANAVTYVASHVNGAYNGDQTAFNLYVSAGQNHVGDAPEVQVLYDFNGDGQWDRVETYNYFATAPVTSWEDYTQGTGLASSTGNFADFNNGTVEIKVWNAIGHDAVSLRTNASASDGQQSAIAIPVNSDQPPSQPSTPTVASLTVDQSAYPLSVGETNQMRLIATMSDGTKSTPANSDVTFASSDSAVATVDANGLITAISPGTATIAATDAGQQATSTITVNPVVSQGVPKSITQDGQTWNLQWDDEFNGPNGAAPDQFKWAYETGVGSPVGWGNNEQEYYTNSTQNAYLDGDGNLVIQAKVQSMGSKSFTSARLNSQNTGSWRYGIIQVRAQLPPGEQGMWPAIWMMPTNNAYGGWPSSGEIDMMEAVDNNMQNVYGTLHFGAYMTYGGGWADYDPYRQGAYTLPDTGYHTYSVEWTPNQIKFYVDNNLYATQDAKNWFSGNGQANAPFDQAFHLIMNMAVGGYWPGYADPSTYQTQQMKVDFVRVYQTPQDYAWPIPGRFNASDSVTSSGVKTETSSDLQYVDSITPQQTNNEAFTYDKDVTYSDASSTTYNVNVTESGTYQVQYRVASATGNATATVSLDGQRISSAAVPNTGGNQNWQTVSDSNFVTLSAGQHQLTIQGSGGNFNLHWIRFIPAGPRYVDDFESPSAKWTMGTYTSGAASMVTGKVDGVYDASGNKVAPAYQGNYDVQLNYSEGSGAVSEWYDHPLQNVSSDSGLKIEVYGQNSGNTFQVNLEANGHEVFNFVDPSHPDYTFKDDFTGWKTIVLPINQLVKASNQPDPGSSPASATPDLTNLYALDILATTPNSKGTLYIDALRTYNDAAQEPAPETVPPITYQSIPGLINGDSFGPESNIQTQTTNDTPGVGDGMNVGYIYSGSWMGYFVDVPQTADYTVSYRASNGSNANGDIQMFEDASQVGTTTIAPTGGWTTWTTVTDTVHLTAGKHLIKLATTQGNWNIHWFKVDYNQNSAVTTTATLSASSPAVNTNWYTVPVSLTLSEDVPQVVANTFYSVNGGAPTSYTQPVTFNQDGDYLISYYSVNKAGTAEAAKTVSFHIDQTAPSISVSAPTASSPYLDSQNVTVSFTVSDSGSGVNTSATKATLDGAAVKNGQSMTLNTLALGSHTLTITAEDNVGNRTSQSVTFSVTANAASLKTTVETMLKNGQIDNSGIANSLLAKLKVGDFASFISEVNAQKGKHIATTAANLLVRDAKWAETH